MRLVKFVAQNGPVYLNPEHVVAVHKGLRDTTIVTVTGGYAVKETPEVVARLLGAEEIAIDVTPVRDRSPTDAD